MGAAGRIAAMQTAPDQVFLHAVIGTPQVVSVVLKASGGQPLRGRDGRGVGHILILEGKRSLCKHVGFGGGQRDGAHGIAVLAHPIETAQNGIGAFENMADHIALVGNANIVHDVAAYQAVIADEAELCPVPNYVPWHPGSGEN